MKDLVFADRGECRREIQGRLGLDTGAAQDHLSGALVDLFEAADESPRQDGFDLRVKHWVIRSDDLKLMEVIKTVAIVFSSANFMISNLTFSGITSVTIGILEVLRNAYRKGARIEPELVQVMIVLEHAKEPVAVSEIARSLISINEGEWDEASVRHALTRLREVHTREGLVAFVETTDDDRWCLIRS